MLILPALAGIENVFYAEPAADVIASAVAVGVYFVFSGRVLGRREAFLGGRSSQKGLSE